MKKQRKLRNRKFLNDFEDIVLGHIAKERYEKNRAKDYVTLEEAAKKMRIKL